MRGQLPRAQRHGDDRSDRRSRPPSSSTERKPVPAVGATLREQVAGPSRLTMSTSIAPVAVEVAERRAAAA